MQVALSKPLPVFLSPSCVASCAASTPCELPPILTMTPRDKYLYCPHLTDEETEAQRLRMSPKVPHQWVLEGALEPQYQPPGP